jgi:osmotically-inducible protein OsmY
MKAYRLNLILFILLPAIAFGGTENLQFASDRAAQANELSDIWIKSKLVTTYTLNSRLNPFAIEVEVNQGIVTLSGTVETNVDRDLAVELARGVSGVNDVMNLLQLDDTLVPHAKHERDFADYVNDANVTAQVKLRLLWNATTEGLQINVTTRDGIVTLSGTVDSEARRNLAIQIARDTQGVREVVAELEVKPTETLADKAREHARQSFLTTKRVMTDSWITMKVYSSLTFESGIDTSRIKVNTQNGVVSLSGKVRSESEHRRILETTRSVVGVKKVIDKLRLALREV